ncbi:MAG: hypothetical protein JWO57_1502 [Pseudonocardiales bacterium]|nr:hypothetical protein [Pseudonocardiales bacterium]
MPFELAQVNVARLAAPLDSPALEDFVAALDPVNAAADVAPGFVWRLQTEDGNATAVQAFEWDAADSAGIITNMSVWIDVEHLAAFLFGDMHRQFLRRRREWFVLMREAYTACWWIPTGERPTTRDAEARIRHLRAHGPTAHAFTLREHYPAPDAAGQNRPRSGQEDWFCPA